MRTRLLPAAALLAAATGCFRIPDDWVSTDIYLALDYRIDRPRVVGIQIDPPWLVHGQPVRIDALVLAPEAVEKRSVAICGLRDDVQVAVWEIGCFGNDDLVDPISDHLPTVWNPPDLSHIDCAEEGWDDSGRTDLGIECASQLPLLVTAETRSGTAYGSADVSIAIQGTSGNARRSLARYPHRLEWTGEARPGGEVTLVFHVEERDVTRFQWYVDGGELLGTGSTERQGVDVRGQWTTNTLRIPSEWVGPLRVAAVASADNWGYRAGDQVWDVVTLEVAP